MEAFVVALQSVWNDSGFSAFTMGHAIMMLVGIILLYLAIGKGFEPLLLSPIAFGCLLANVPKTGFEDQPGVMQVILYGINHEIFPPLIFLARCNDRLWSVDCKPENFAFGRCSSSRCIYFLAGRYDARIYRARSIRYRYYRWC